MGKHKGIIVVADGELPTRYRLVTYEYIFILPTNYLRVIFWIPTKYLLITYELPTSYFLDTYELPTSYPGYLTYLRVLHAYPTYNFSPRYLAYLRIIFWIPTSSLRVTLTYDLRTSYPQPTQDCSLPVVSTSLSGKKFSQPLQLR